MTKRAVIGAVCAISTLFATQISALTFADNSTNFSITTDAVLQLDVPNSASLLLTPTSSAGDFKTTTITATVSTNNMLGYTLTVSPTNAAETTDLIGTNTNMSALASSDEGYTESSFTANKWGYRLSDNSNYFGMPATLAPEAWDTSGPANETEHNLTLAAKVDGSFPAGSYATTLNFELVAKMPPRDFPEVVPNCTAHPEKCDTVTGKVAIQSIDEDICDAVEVFDSQYQVTDLRDHKNYWISKLRDGHCWMTQNLDLDLDSTKTYTHDNTDLGWGSDKATISWRPTNGTIPVENIGQYGWISDWAEDKNVPYSMDTGDWYWTDTWYESTTNNYTDGDLGDPAKFAQTPYTNNGTHGHVGNYYNWPAAIASNDASGYTANTSSDPSNNPQNSICPAGWRLPTIRVISSVAYFDKDARNEYEYLLNQYGNYSNGSYGSDNVLAAAPLYFVRSGRIRLGRDGGYLSDSGSFGYYWSSTVNDGNDARIIQFTSSNILPTTYKTRNLGHPVRCLVRADDKAVVTFLSNDGYLKTQQIKKNSSTNLASNSFVRSGYVFNGWNTRADGLGEGYGDGAEVSFDSDVTLYAQWKQDDGSAAGITIQRAYELAYTEHEKGMYEETTPGSGVYEWIDSWGDDDYKGQGRDVRFAMQDIDLTYNNTKVCDLVTVIGDQYQALDVRDNKLYYISKLADGNCWMTQNLDLRLSTSATLSPSTTDIPEPWTPPVSTDDEVAISQWRSGNNQSATDPTCNNSIPYLNSMPPFSKSGNGLYWNGNKTGSSVIDNATSSGNSHWQIGTVYSFGAATAIDNTSLLSAGTVVNQSICPANWKIPDASTEPGGAAYLVSRYNNLASDTSQSPLFFTYTGSVALNLSSSFSGVSPYYTLNKIESNNNCNNTMRYFQPGYYPVVGATMPTYYGLPIRCLAR